MSLEDTFKPSLTEEPHAVYFTFLSIASTSLNHEGKLGRMQGLVHREPQAGRMAGVGYDSLLKFCHLKRTGALHCPLRVFRQPKA